MENVPEVIGVGNVQHFNKWLDKLESLGYTNHFQILNGKDYGIPQNRRRVFMVSILGDYAYDFPIKLKLKYRLKDFLEKQVDEKYYLSDKDIERISSWDSYEKPIENAIDVDDKSEDSQVVPTLTTHVGKDSAGMKLVKVGNYGNGFFSKNVYDSDGISPTLTCGNHGLGTAITDKAKKTNGGLQIMENTKQGYKIAQPGDGVNLASRMKHQRGNVQRGSIQTLKTEMEIGVVVDEQETKKAP